jgi:hypothetical protein
MMLVPSITTTAKARAPRPGFPPPPLAAATMTCRLRFGSVFVTGLPLRAAMAWQDTVATVLRLPPAGMTSTASVSDTGTREIRHDHCSRKQILPTVT